jgi:hypothetical protein
MSKRKQTRALTRWTEEVRQWATAAGRALALDLYYNRESNLRPYDVGVVLNAGEKVWAEIPLRFNLQGSRGAGHCQRADAHVVRSCRCPACRSRRIPPLRSDWRY